MTIAARSIPEADWPGVAASFLDLTFEQGLTYARAAADRTSEGERGDFDLAPNGLPVDRRERSAFADLLREIGHDAPGPEPGRED